MEKENELDAHIRLLLTSTIKKSRKGRNEIAADMSLELGRTAITKKIIDSWTAPSKHTHRMPVLYMPAFCRATGDYELIKFIAEAASGLFISNDDIYLLELGRIEEQKAELQKKEHLIREFLGQVRNNGGGK